MVKNEIVELEISDLASDGNGVGRVEGCAVFVPFTLPGDRIRARIVKIQKNFAFGILVDLLTGGKDRITPDCPAFGRCGGCALREISYTGELAAKTKFVQDAFDRIGGFAVSAAPCLPSPSPERYRNKVQYPLATDQNGRVFAGFLRTPKPSRHLLPRLSSSA